MKYFFSLVSLAVLLGLFSCSQTKEKPDTSQDTVSTVKQDSVVKEDTEKPTILPVQKDAALDHAARFIAGMEQLDSNSFTLLQKDKYWIDYKNSMDQNWEKMYDTRLKKMKEWEEGTLSSQRVDSLTLFYPFSGPDFLHAYYLFPSTSQYIMAALEPVREIAPMDSLPVSNRDKFLDSLGNSLRDIFSKSYFITTHMQSDLKQVKGVLPPLYFFIERSGHELLSQKFITLDSAGEEQEITGKKLHWQKTPGVKLMFLNRETQQVKTLYYFSISISNGGLKDRPEFMKFLEKRKPFNTFVKSASYLMHKEAFTSVRDLIMSKSETLFQDDTGIPYRYFKNRMEWSGQFYGEYTKPVKDFAEALFQKDLDSAYKQSSKPLPFSLGYHWGSNKQNYMLFKKSKETFNQKK